MNIKNFLIMMMFISFAGVDASFTIRNSTRYDLFLILSTPGSEWRTSAAAFEMIRVDAGQMVEVDKPFNITKIETDVIMKLDNGQERLVEVKLDKDPESRDIELLHNGGGTLEIFRGSRTLLYRVFGMSTMKAAQ